MAINGGTVLVDGTITPSAGTSTAYAFKSHQGNKSIFYLDDGSELVNQIELHVTTKDPKPQASAPNGFTQARTIMRELYPRTPSGGSRSIDSITVELSCDVNTTDAQKTTMMKNAAQWLIDADFTEAFHNQSKA